jgi:hypothetical protein
MVVVVVVVVVSCRWWGHFGPKSIHVNAFQDSEWLSHKGAQGEGWGGCGRARNRRLLRLIATFECMWGAFHLWFVIFVVLPVVATIAILAAGASWGGWRCSALRASPCAVRIRRPPRCCTCSYIFLSTSDCQVFNGCNLCGVEVFCVNCLDDVLRFVVECCGVRQRT